MVKYLIWDFDGVICDSKDIAFEVHNQIAIEYSKLPAILDGYDYAKIMCGEYDESLARYLTKNQIDKYFLKHRETMFNRRFELNIYSKVLDFIKNKKIPSIIITATYEKLVLDVLKNNGYDEKIFKYILGREKEGSKKDKLNKLCKDLGISKDDIVYIGDTLSDVDLCKRVDVSIICAGYGYCPSALFEKKKILKLCNSEEELIRYIDTEIEFDQI